jgi:tetratricopeptide (TPR) repeat protein
MPYEERGRYYHDMGQFNNAIKDFTKAISLDKEDWTTFGQRGDSYAALKEYDKAIKDYTMAITLTPTNAYVMTSYYCDRGKIYLLINQRQKAKQDFQKCCDLSKMPELDCSHLTELKKQEARGDKWVFILDAHKSNYYYDKTTLKKLPQKHIQVWIREEQDASSLLEFRKSNNLSTKGYEKFSHSLNLWEIDCGSQKIGLISYHHYDDKGQVLDSNSIDKLQMNTIVPDSLAESFYKTFCGKKKE